jgi:serine/threonine-protein kinase
VLSDRYRLDERLAIGGMGEVWRATDQTLGRTVAVKVLLPALLAQPGFAARFQSEARMMSALRHPGVVQVFDYGETTVADGNVVYLVMAYVEGEPLSERIAAAGRLGADETMSVVARAADALEPVHAAGIVHRDIKPANLLVQADGSVVLVDFGVAHDLASTRITGTNMVLGTAHYMAPEQVSNKPVSARTDIYALGALAYHCLAGHPPFGGGTALEIAAHHLHDEPPPLPDDVPPAVRTVVERALAKDPEARYPNVKALAAAARAAAAGAGMATVPLAAVGTAALEPTAPVARPAAAGDTSALPAQSGPQPWYRKPPVMVAGIVVAALLVVAVAVAALRSGDDSTQPTPGATTPSAVPATTTPTRPNGTRPNPASTPTSAPNQPTGGPAPTRTGSTTQPTEGGGNSPGSKPANPPVTPGTTGSAAG